MPRCAHAISRKGYSVGQCFGQAPAHPVHDPDSPYEFSVLPADILGQVYQQFLGKVIRLTAGHHAVVEDKPEVKKAPGVLEIDDVFDRDRKQQPGNAQ